MTRAFRLTALIETNVYWFHSIQLLCNFLTRSISLTLKIICSLSHSQFHLSTHCKSPYFLLPHYFSVSSSSRDLACDFRTWHFKRFTKWAKYQISSTNLTRMFHDISIKANWRRRGGFKLLFLPSFQHQSLELSRNHYFHFVSIKTWHDWVGKIIHWESRKRLKLEHAEKWYMHKPETVLVHGGHKSLRIFEIKWIIQSQPDQVFNNKDIKKKLEIYWVVLFQQTK